jgi:small nuclear ribonucleoprotein (snRNP)-like protein
MDSLTLTIIFIVASTVVGAFIKGRMRDKCLLDLADNFVNIEFKDGKVIWGILEVEATGIELKYKQRYLDKQDNHIETSYVIYKNEYPNIQCIIRFLNDMDDRNKKRRSNLLSQIRNRKGLTGLRRKIRNFFATVRDSVMEVMNLLMGRMRQFTPVARVLSGQDKYVSQMQEGVFSSFSTSYEPLLEKHLGKKVILALFQEGNKIEYAGVLKGYTAEFLELMDVDYRLSNKEPRRKADIVVPRTVALMRHLGE